MESVREEVVTLLEWIGNEVTEDDKWTEALNECFTEKRTLKMCRWKLTVVSTLMDDFQASEAEILNKLEKVETNKSSTLYDTGPKALRKATFLSFNL